MTITPQTLTRHELHGLAVTVADASNPDLVGLAGRVIRETTHTLTIRPGAAPLGDVTARERQVPKADTTFTFELPDGAVTVAGERLVARPALRTEQTGVSPWV